MDLTLHDIVQQFQEIKWTKINNFSIEMHPVNSQFANIIGFPSDSDFDKKINMSLISIDTPEYANADIAEFIGTSWKYHVGRDELYRFDLTFRDSEQLSLYRMFLTAYNKQKGQYANRIYFNFKVFLDEDFGVDKTVLFETSQAMLENVSKLQFSHNTENQIAEFSIRFKCNTPISRITKTI